MRRMMMVGLLLALVAQHARVLAACVGDCGGDGRVTIDELVLGVNIALGAAELGQCTTFDGNGDGRVTVDELIDAVSNAESGCSVVGATPTPTPEALVTPTAGVVPPGISTQMLGIWSGRAVNQSTGVDKPARLKIEVTAGKVIVTDSGGTVFLDGSTLTVTVTTPTAIFVTNTVGVYPGGYIETLQLAIAPNGQLAGAYGKTTLSFPPVVNVVGLVLDKES